MYLSIVSRGVRAVAAVTAVEDGVSAYEYAVHGHVLQSRHEFGFDENIHPAPSWILDPLRLLLATMGGSPKLKHAFLSHGDAWSVDQCGSLSLFPKLPLYD